MIQAGGRETAILTFEYQNGTISTAVAAMGTFGDQPYARELRQGIPKDWLMYVLMMFFMCIPSCVKVKHRKLSKVIP